MLELSNVRPSNVYKAIAEKFAPESEYHFTVAATTHCEYANVSHLAYATTSKVQYVITSKQSNLLWWNKTRKKVDKEKEGWSGENCMTIIKNSNTAFWHFGVFAKR
jgi:hypothetical protein